MRRGASTIGRRVTNLNYGHSNAQQLLLLTTRFRARATRPSLPENKPESNVPLARYGFEVSSRGLEKRFLKSREI